MTSPPSAREIAGAEQRQSRHEDVGHVVDDEVEAFAGEARQALFDVRHARERAVDAVDDEREAEPGEHALPRAVEGGERSQ